MEAVAEMRFGIVLPTYLYSAERKQMAERSYASLARTEVPEGHRPLRIFVVAANSDSADVALDTFMPSFAVKVTGTKGWILKDDAAMSMRVWLQPPEVAGLDPSIAWLVEKFFSETDFTHVIELADDMVYNPKWFLELKALVERHPDARAWSVYRSAHTRHHNTIGRCGGEYADHRVTSMAGNGTCWTKEEWAAWGVKWQQGPTWPVPTGGDTLDLHHAYFRPGERWVTDISYLEHIGIVGIHAAQNIPEHAVNFAGEQ